jgi:glycine/D-amino acid oxidase-like deaminating enzyme
VRADVLIVGGGIVGTAAAWHLARGGADVVLVEAGSVACRASGANAGSLHVQIPYSDYAEHGRAWAEAYAPALGFAKAAVLVWRELGAALDTDLEVEIGGGLCVAETPEQLRALRDKAAIEARHGVETEMLGSAEVRSLAPFLSDRVIGGAFCAAEGRANPLLASGALAGAARRAGARLLLGTRVEAIADAPEGFRVRTGAGEIAARRVLNAAGAEAGRVAAMLGVALAVEAAPIMVSVTEPVAPFLPFLLYSAAGRLTLKQMANGNMVIGGGWPARLGADGSLGLRPVSIAANMAAAVAAVPALGAARLLRAWPGLVNGTPDWRPVIGEMPGRPGAFIAMVPWVGFTGGPAAGLAVAEMILGRPPSVDLAGVVVPGA